MNRAQGWKILDNRYAVGIIYDTISVIIVLDQPIRNLVLLVKDKSLLYLAIIFPHYTDS